MVLRMLNCHFCARIRKRVVNTALGVEKFWLKNTRRTFQLNNNRTEIIPFIDNAAKVTKTNVEEMRGNWYYINGD